MERNIRKRLKSNQGITLVALVVTIIVLLILVAVSLSAVFNQNGIFSKATSATALYGKEKSKEELTMALSDATMKKYTSGLTAAELDEMLNRVGQVDGDDNTKVTVGGHNWKIDRNELTIIDYLGEDDGIEIRYTVEGNDNYITGTPNITVHVTVANNKGALDINTIKITKGGVDITNSIAIQSNGTFTLTVTEPEGATFTVSAKNSEGEQSNPRTITITPKVDGIKPTISGQTATASGMKITIKAYAADNESKLASFTYSVSPATVKDGKATGNLTSGVPLEIETTAEGSYTVTFTATDNEGNTTTATAGPVTTTDTISVADLKAEINKNSSNWVNYLGMKVNYNSPEGGTWRVFYYDGTEGYFGRANTVYLKRDYDSTKTVNPYGSWRNVTPSSTAVGYMEKLNPLWKNSTNGSSIDVENEKMSAGFYEQTNYGSYKNSTYSSYAIGSAPIEMWTRAQSSYKNKYDTSVSTIGCGIKNKYGYGYTINGGSLVDYKSTTVVNTSIPQSAVIARESEQWLASPSSNNNNNVCNVNSSNVNNNNTNGVCPVDSLETVNLIVVGNYNKEKLRETNQILLQSY